MATKKSGAKKTTSQSSGSARSKKSANTQSSKDTKNTKSAKNGIGATEELLIRRAKSTNLLSIFESVVIGVLGVFLITKPTWITQVIFYIIGIILMVKGVYKIVNYFVVHGKSDFYNNDLLYGVIALIFGILIVILWEKLSDAIGIVVGAWMIYGALVRLNAAIKLHAAAAKNWFYVLLLSLLMLALGIYLIIYAGAGIIVQVVGVIMIIAAVVGVVDDAVYMKELNDLSK